MLLLLCNFTPNVWWYMQIRQRITRYTSEVTDSSNICVCIGQQVCFVLRNYVFCTRELLPRAAPTKCVEIYVDNTVHCRTADFYFSSALLRC